MSIISLIENCLGIANILISIVIIIFGISFFNRLRFRLQKRAVCFFLIGIFLFASTEILIVTNISGETESIELLKNLAKSTLIISLGVTLFFFQQSEQHEVAKLRYQAFKDALTGLYNYAYFRQSGQRKFLEVKRRQLPLSVMMIDIDNFKAYNDQFGHEAGNIALRCFAEELKRTTRGYDLVARYGGEEFVVLVDSDLDDSFILAQRICHRISTTCVPQYHKGLSRQITVSIGLASLTKSMKTLEELIEAADLELYQAKQSGKNRVHFINKVNS